MPFCPHCGTQVAFGDVACYACHELLPPEIADGIPPETMPAAAQPATPSADIAAGWTDFGCWDGSFTLKHPPDWQRVDPPVSEGASLSCAGPDRFTLLEAFGMEHTADSGRNPVATVGDGIVATLGQEEGHANGRLISRGAVRFRDADACERIVVAYTDRGLETTTDYFIVGRGRRAVLLALKVLAPEYEGKRPIFDRVIESLRAPWLATAAVESRAIPKTAEPASVGEASASTPPPTVANVDACKLCGNPFAGSRQWLVGDDELRDLERDCPTALRNLFPKFQGFGGVSRAADRRACSGCYGRMATTLWTHSHRGPTADPFGASLYAHWASPRPQSPAQNADNKPQKPNIDIPRRKTRRPPRGDARPAASGSEWFGAIGCLVVLLSVVAAAAVIVWRSVSR